MEYINKLGNITNFDDRIIETTDRNNSTDIKDFEPIIDETGISNIQIKVPENIDENSVNIVGYAYLADGKVKEFTKNKIANIQGLKVNIEYKIEIIAMDENGKIKKSSEIKAKTELPEIVAQNNGLVWSQTENDNVYVTGHQSRNGFRKSSLPAVYSFGYPENSTYASWICFSLSANATTIEGNPSNQDAITWGKSASYRTITMSDGGKLYYTYIAGQWANTTNATITVNGIEYKTNGVINYNSINSSNKIVIKAYELLKDYANSEY